MEVLRKGPKMFFIVECPECGSLLRGEEAEFHPVYGQAGALLEFTKLRARKPTALAVG